MRAERHRAAMMAKYGVANAFQLDSSIDKIQKKRRMQMDSIVEKMERTNEAKYGVSDWMKDPVRYAEFSKKMMERYGYKDYLSKLQSERMCEKEASGETRAILGRVEYLSVGKDAVAKYKGYLVEVDSRGLECLDNVVEKMGEEAVFRCKKCGREFRYIVDFGDVPKCSECSKVVEEERVEDYLKSLGIKDMQYRVKVDSEEYDGVSFEWKFYCREVEDVRGDDVERSVREVRDRMGVLCCFSREEWEKRRDVVKSVISRGLHGVEYVRYSECRVRSVSEEESRVFYRENSMVEKSGIVDMVGIEKGGELVAIIDLECDERKVPYIDMVEKNYKKVVGVGEIVESIKSKYGLRSVYEKRVRRYEGKSLFGLSIKESVGGYDIYESV
jgi:DNA-directed RNA polymerase subunit RPC12/RpoP